jgi:UDP-N-acetylenolpyruvoylglucosamine reductase
MKFDPSKIASQLAAVTDGDIETGKPLAPYTSYKIGGPTAVWVALSDSLTAKKYRFLSSAGDPMC